MNLQQLGWKEPFTTHFARIAGVDQKAAAERVPARVARQDRQGYVLYAAGRALRGVVSGHFRHTAPTPDAFPAVGDWVAVSPQPDEPRATIHAVLPRSSAVHRKVAGTRSDSQVVAANVDRLLICVGLDLDFNLRRIERYVTLAYASGAAPFILLTKSDLCAEAARCVAQVQEIAIGTPVLALSAATGDGLAAVGELSRPGLTLALVGSSGVGKSTLINALLGREAMATRAVRAHDHRGQHTTTHRQLLLVPDGGVVIDTPGMRELQLPADASAEAAFADIESLSSGCRFGDCRHEQEPGCRVRAALETGELDEARLESYRKQQREIAYFERRDDPVAMAENKARWKAIQKSVRRDMRQRGRY